MQKLLSFLFFSVIISIAFNTTALGQQTGSLGGQVQDTLGAVVVGATITVVAPNGTEKTATTNQRGEFSVTGLAPGKYTVKVIAPNFGLYENTEVEIAAGQRQELIVPLTLEGVQEQVDVSGNEGVSTDPSNNAG